MQTGRGIQTEQEGLLASQTVEHACTTAVVIATAGPPRPPVALKQRRMTAMRYLLVATTCFLVPTAISATAIRAEEAKVQCPGENTLEMRYCAGLSWEQSTDQLKRKIPMALFQQWQEMTRAVCARAYAPYQGGTIHPQLVVGCDDNLNRALLKEFQPLNNQGDLERTP